MDLTKISKINHAIAEFFSTNPSITKVKAKELMPLFLQKGIFTQDRREGLPIRELLRYLDETNQLHLIPSILVERKTTNRNWYFIKPGKQLLIPKEQPTSQKAEVKTNSKRSNSDEDYVLNLCDKLLQLKSLRQYKFDFLVGDPGKNGICQKLPVDSYYPQLKLVIEYKEKQHTESVKLFDKPDKITVSGVHRGEQRKLYDQKRRTLLPENGIQLVEMSYSDFNYNSLKKIIRNPERDIEVIKRILLNSGVLD